MILRIRCLSPSASRKLGGFGNCWDQFFQNCFQSDCTKATRRVRPVDGGRAFSATRPTSLSAEAPAARLPSSPPPSSPFPPRNSKARESDTPRFPPSRNPLSSAKLAALHARLNLSFSFPIETLARCLVDASCEPNPKFNNSGLANLGNNLLGYLLGEHIMVKYPRLPIPVIRAAMWAHISPKALHALGTEWGVEAAFKPTLEADAGLLQFGRLRPGALWGPAKWAVLEKAKEKGEVEEAFNSYDDPDSGITITNNPRNTPTNPISNEGIPLETAMAHFVKSVFAGIYLHEGGITPTKQFFRQHILSRKLDFSKLFDFSQPTRQLSRLCAREGFQPPVARLLAETGRRSRSAVYIVGVYSGSERLGEGYGASSDEARIKAAVNALKSWYLYSPILPFEARSMDVPSKTLERPDEKYTPAYVDVGEIIV